MGIGDGRLYGNYRAKVLENNDPLLYGRVRIWIPDIMPDIEEKSENCIWAFPANNPIGGRNDIESTESQYYVGSCYIPPIGTYIWIFFEGGDINRPYYFASLDTMCSPVVAENQSGTEPWNKWTLLKTARGRAIVISDDESDCRVEITGKKRNLTDPPAGNLDSVFDIDGNQTTILLEETEGNERLLIKSHLGDFINMNITKQELHAEFKNDIHIKSGKSIFFTAEKNINIMGLGQTMITGLKQTHIKSTGVVAIDGSQTRIQQGMAQMASKAMPFGQRSTNASGSPADYSDAIAVEGPGFDSAQVNALSWTDPESTNGWFGDASVSLGVSNPLFVPTDNDLTTLGKSFTTWVSNIPTNTWQQVKDKSGNIAIEVMKRGIGTLDFRYPNTTDILRSFSLPTTLTDFGLNIDISKLPTNILNSFGNQLWTELKDVMGFYFEGFFGKFSGIFHIPDLTKSFNITQWTSTRGLGEIASDYFKSFIPTKSDYLNIAKSFISWGSSVTRGVLQPFYDQYGKIYGYVQTNFINSTRDMVFEFYDSTSQKLGDTLKINELKIGNSNILQSLGDKMWSTGKDALGGFMSYYVNMTNGVLPNPNYNDLLPISWPGDDIVDDIVNPPDPGLPTFPTPPIWMIQATRDVWNYISVSAEGTYILWPGEQYSSANLLYGYKIKFDVVENDYLLTYKTPAGYEISCMLNKTWTEAYNSSILWDWADTRIQSTWARIYYKEPNTPPVEEDPPNGSDWSYSDYTAPTWMLRLVDPVFEFIYNSSYVFDQYYQWPGYEERGSFLYDYRIKKHKSCGGRYQLIWCCAPTYRDHGVYLAAHYEYDQMAQDLWTWADVKIRQVWGNVYA